MKHAIAFSGLLGLFCAGVMIHAAAARHDAALGVRGRSNAAAAVAARGDLVVVAWGASLPGGATDVYAAVSRDGGRTFGAPVRVNDVSGDASVGGEQPPHVALVPREHREPAVVVVWTAKRPGGTRILSARSDDGGASFARAAPIAGGEAAGNRGWEAITTANDGRVVAVWLDHRETASAASGQPMHQHEGHDHAPAGQAPADGWVRAQLSKLYFSRLENGSGASPSGDAHAIAAGVCYCCKTAIAAGADGAIYAAWRHVYPGNIRDIAFTMSKDDGRTFTPPVRVSDDRWVLDGCPENGPAMAIDGRQRIHVVWPTLVNAADADDEPTLELFYAASDDGRGFSPRRRLPAQGVPRHAQIAVAADDSVVAIWEEQTSSTRRVVVGRGAEGFAREIVSRDGRAVYPVLAAAGSSIVAAWTSEAPDRSMIQVARFDR